jgi:hypothetical protein
MSMMLRRRLDNAHPNAEVVRPAVDQRVGHVRGDLTHALGAERLRKVDEANYTAHGVRQDGSDFMSARGRS